MHTRVVRTRVWRWLRREHTLTLSHTNRKLAGSPLGGRPLPVASEHPGFVVQLTWPCPLGPCTLVHPPLGPAPTLVPSAPWGLF